MAEERKCRKCNNRISGDSPIDYCYLHEHEQLAVTPKGQYGFRNATGPGSWQHRLLKEKQLSFPKDSANVDGYPYFTLEDLQGHVNYLNGDDKYKPDALNVLDRFPIQSFVTSGKNIVGNEIGIVDSLGKIHTFDEKEPESADELRSFSVDNGASLLAISDDEKYQVIIVDEEAIIESAIANNLSVNISNV